MQAQRKIVKFNESHRSRGTAADVHFGVIENMRQRILVTLDGIEMGAHEDVQPLIEDVRRALGSIRGVNESIRKHGYNPQADEAIVKLADAVCTVLAEPAWLHVNHWLVEFMQDSAVSIKQYANQRRLANGTG